MSWFVYIFHRGLGKTTLAQLAYNDERIKNSFDKQIWVCVSEPFEQVKIAKDIIEGLRGDTQNAATLDTLLRRICDMVKEQKFLLVLDDVWTKERKDWGTTRACSSTWWCRE
ncbi:hypothetical protein UlMin_019281 [Ulmus minor]